MGNSLREGMDMPKSDGGSPKKLRDSGMPKVPGPAGNMGGGLSAATKHLSRTVKGEAKMHKCRKD